MEELDDIISEEDDDMIYNNVNNLQKERENIEKKFFYKQKQMSYEINYMLINIP